MQPAYALALDSDQYENLSTYRDADGDALYLAMDVKPRPCFTWGLIRDLLAAQKRFSEGLRFNPEQPRCIVYASQTPGIFSLGGDLSLFQAATETKDRTMLTHYIEDCVSALHNLLSTPEAVSISVLEGDALGAGLETALASDVIIAEKGVRAGFPEVLFNSIPGAGGFYLLARRVGLQMAEKMIRAGNVHTAEELHALGVIDILAEKGKGRQAVRELLDSQKRSWNTYRALLHVKRHYMPITRDMLLANAKVWVDAVMRLTDRDLRLMERLVRAQERRANIGLPTLAVAETVAHRAAA